MLSIMSLRYLELRIKSRDKHVCVNHYPHSVLSTSPLLQGLSNYLTENLGKGFSAENLRLMRKFFLIYSSDKISKSPIGKSNPNISWTHYIQLMRIANEDERRFYELEQKLIDHLQQFLLELGKGFAFTRAMCRNATGYSFSPTR